MMAQIIPFPNHAPIVPTGEPPPSWSRRMPHYTGWVNFNDYLVADVDTTYALNVQGSNEELGIADGDMLISNLVIPPRAGDLVLIEEGDDLIIRRFEESNLKLVSRSGKRSTQAKIFGVVVHHIRKLRDIPSKSRKKGKRQ